VRRIEVVSSDIAPELMHAWQLASKYMTQLLPSLSNQGVCVHVPVLLVSLCAGLIERDGGFGCLLCVLSSRGRCLQRDGAADAVALGGSNIAGKRLDVQLCGHAA
jgi:hypothetical protein